MSFAWSYTAVDMFELCNKKYYHIKVLKDVKDEDSQFAGDGKAIHDGLYRRVIHAKPLPIELRYLEPMAKKFADSAGEKRGELQLALNENLRPTTWFGQDTWVRAIIDILVIKGSHAIIVDYKTGKRKDNWDQIKLSAAVLSQFMPEIEDFTLTYAWTKTRELTPPLTMKKQHMADVWADFYPRVQAILDAMKTTTFPAESNPLCKWCPVTSCPHNKKS